MMTETAKALTPSRLAGYFDHTFLKPFATCADLRRLCEESMKYGFAMVAINPAPVAFCRDVLKGSGVHVGAAIGFPLGQNTKEIKRSEAIDAIENGADEIDYVVNITQLKEKNYDYIEAEMAGIVEVCRSEGKISKVIFENCFLTDDEKRELCRIALNVRPDFIKTSTGFGTGGATFDDVRLMKEAVGDAIKVKAAGGVRDLDTALQMIELGAERIGTSASVTIMEEFMRRFG